MKAGAKTRSGRAATLAALERAIVADPDDAAAYLVYADALQQRGDPRGELIALQHGRTTAPEDASLAARERRLLPQFLDGIAALGTWTWRLGFLERAELHRPSVAEFAAVLDHPSSRLLRELSFDASWSQAPSVFARLGARQRPTLRALRFERGDLMAEPRARATPRAHDHETADAVLQNLPELRTAELVGWDFTGTLDHPTLETLVISGGNPCCRKCEKRWQLPAVEKLVWSMESGDVEGMDAVTVDDLAPLWRAKLPVLRHLDLSGTMITGPLLGVKPLHDLVKRLEVLRLGVSPRDTSTSELVRSLVGHQRAFAHLRELAITRPLDATPADVEKLHTALPRFRWIDIS